MQYSKALHKLICDLLREGRPKTLAFKLAGVHPDTVWDWLRMGRTSPDRYPQYVQLAEDIEQAIADAEAEALDLIRAAAKSDPKHWTAAAWYLERTNPKEYGKRDTVEIEGGTRPLVQLNQLVLTDPEVREQARDLLRRVTQHALPTSRETVDSIAEEVDGDDD
jgi:hypothetical protein